MSESRESDRELQQELDNESAHESDRVMEQESDSASGHESDRASATDESDGESAADESGHESDRESDGEADPCDDIIDTFDGHKKHSIFPVFNLPFGRPFSRSIAFDTQCPTFPTTWSCRIKLELAEHSGHVSYRIKMKRTDETHREINAAAKVRIQDNTLRNGFFHEQDFGRSGMKPGHEIRYSHIGAVSAEEMQNLPDDELVLHVELFVSSCHRNPERRRPPESSNDISAIYGSNL